MRCYSRPTGVRRQHGRVRARGAGQTETTQREAETVWHKSLSVNPHGLLEHLVMCDDLVICRHW